jgi:sarcosine oxidase delta subunit
MTKVYCPYCNEIIDEVNFRYFNGMCNKCYNKQRGIKK